MSNPTQLPSHPETDLCKKMTILEATISQSAINNPAVSKPVTTWAVIPARSQSVRFPGKPLASILGKPMIEHVWQRTQASPEVNRTFIATDDEDIAKAARGFKAEVVMTGTCETGGERVAEAIHILTSSLKSGRSPDWVLNVQGDEPTINPQDLSTLVKGMNQARNQSARLGTLIYPITEQQVLDNPHVVKVVINQQQQALYFSRAPIPHVPAHAQSETGTQLQSCWQHIGVYCFKTSFLETFATLPNTPLSQQEQLEQLRVLEHGIPIFCFPAQTLSIGVDAPADIAKAEKALLSS